MSQGLVLAVLGFWSPVNFYAWFYMTPHFHHHAIYFQLKKKDIKAAKKSKLKLTITLVSVTIVVVLVLTLICYCCVKCGQNCPCCFLCCPCLIPLSFIKDSIDPSELKKEEMKTFVPGVITHKDGTIEHYKPSPEEMECLLEIMGK